MPTLPARRLSALPRLAPALGAVALPLPLFTTPAEAQGFRHITNTSTVAWQFHHPASRFPVARQRVSAVRLLSPAHRRDLRGAGGPSRKLKSC